MKQLLYILFILTVFSCSQSRESKSLSATPTEEELMALYQESISSHISNGLTKLEASHLNDIVGQIYQNNSFNLIWSNGDSLTLNGQGMIDAIINSWGYGLPINYRQAEISSLRDSLKTDLPAKAKAEIFAQLDLLITFNGLRLAGDLKYGIINKDSLNMEDHIDSLTQADVDILLTCAKDELADEVLMRSFAPQHQLAQELIQGLKSYVKSTTLNDETFTLPNYKQDSIKSYTIAKEALIKHGYSDSQRVAVDSLFKVDLIAFQELNGLGGDFKIGNFTKDAIGMSNLDRYIKAVATLEKWKLKKFETTQYFFVNVPSYQLRYFNDDTITATHRVVVGTPVTSTPSFSAKLKYINVNPRWHVPYSISSKEILPSVKKDVSYFTRHGYKVYTMDRELVDPQTVDWNEVSSNNFKYRVVQNSGTYNSLGIVAFMFPNENSVFIHDTPSKYFFSQDVRAYSHGCVRLDKPIDLAKLVLEHDENEYNNDSLDTMLVKRVERRIYLNKPIDVHIDYFTTETNSKGKIIFYRDIYGRDEKLTGFIKAAIKEDQSHGQIL